MLAICAWRHLWIIPYLIFLVLQNGNFEELGVLQSNATECQIALENLQLTSNDIIAGNGSILKVYVYIVVLIFDFLMYYIALYRMSDSVGKPTIKKPSIQFRPGQNCGIPYGRIIGDPILSPLPVRPWWIDPRALEGRIINAVLGRCRANPWLTTNQNCNFFFIYSWYLFPSRIISL